MKTKTYHLSARTPLCWALMFVLWLGFGGRALAQPGWVLSHQKISDTEGDFDGTLDDTVYFGKSLAWLGDLDGDGVADLAAGAYGDDDGGTNRGAVWVLFLNSDGTVKSHQKISDTQGGFTGTLHDFDFFGASAASLGDIDGDGVGDLAVGAHGDDDGGDSHGAVWILFLNTDGTVKSHKKISDTEGGFIGNLDDGDQFGFSVASRGDLDGDGVGDLAVGAPSDDDGGAGRGAVWMLFLNSNGTVKSHQKISSTEGGFTGLLNDFDTFGSSVASMGDLDGDGVDDLAVAAIFDDDGGAVWMLFLNTDATVKSHQKISSTEGGFKGREALEAQSLGSVGDLDGDGVGDLGVGAPADDDGGQARGAVWILFLGPDGTVHSHQKISDTQGGFTGDLSDLDLFGASVTSVGDLDGDGLGDLAVAAIGDNDGGSPPNANRGAVWVLFLGFGCEGDANGDGLVDPLDSGFVLARFGCEVGTGDPDCDTADMNGDGQVDPLDVGFVLARFGECS